MTGNQKDLIKLQLVDNVACGFHLGNLCHKNVHPTETTGIQELFTKRDVGGRSTSRTAVCNVIVPIVRTVIRHKAIYSLSRTKFLEQSGQTTQGY